jgi:hypothetical protein
MTALQGDPLIEAERRIVLLETVVREAAAHVDGLLTIDTARYGARDWLRELEKRTGMRGLYRSRAR